MRDFILGESSVRLTISDFDYRTKEQLLRKACYCYRNCDKRLSILHGLTTKLGGAVNNELISIAIFNMPEFYRNSLILE